MPKRKLQGIVTSTKMAKTVVVQVKRLVQHPKYLKRRVISRKFKAHYEGDAIREGDVVIIEETKPISKDKRWQVVGASGEKTDENEKEVSKEEKI